MTLDDVSHQLHLHTEGRLLDHDNPLSKNDVVDLMVELLEDDVVESEYQMKSTNGAHERLSWLGKDFKLRLKATYAAEEDRNDDEMF